MCKRESTQTSLTTEDECEDTDDAATSLLDEGARRQTEGTLMQDAEKDPANEILMMNLCTWERKQKMTVKAAAQKTLPSQRLFLLLLVTPHLAGKCLLFVCSFTTLLDPRYFSTATSQVSQ